MNVAVCYTSDCNLCCDTSAGSLAGRSLQGLQRRFAAGDGADIHDDFKPQFKQEPATSAQETIREDLNQNRVMLYMKVLLDSPQCLLYIRALTY